ncbi:hypothetical protein ACFSHP_14585 [Novosphingobium panipatense]
MSTGTVVITGAAGDGPSRRAAFRSPGPPLLLCDLDAARLESLAEELRPHAGKVRILAADIASPDFPQDLIGALTGNRSRH